MPCPSQIPAPGQKFRLFAPGLSGWGRRDGLRLQLTDTLVGYDVDSCNCSLALKSVSKLWSTELNLHNFSEKVLRRAN